MFTGIIEDVGTLAEFRRTGTGATVVVSTRLGNAGETALGDSIAVDGCCLTVTRFGDGRFEADLSAETLARTTLGSLAAGRRVNLERALAAGARMGGHIVQGHVDSVGSIASIREDGETRVLRFRCDAGLRPYLAEKGSVAVNGVSLTVNEVTPDGFGVTLVPFTLSHTTFGDLKDGAPVNLEADVVAKYVLRGLQALTGGKLPQGSGEPPGGARTRGRIVTLDFLKEHGFA